MNDFSGLDLRQLDNWIQMLEDDGGDPDSTATEQKRQSKSRPNMPSLHWPKIKEQSTKTIIPRERTAN